MSEQLRKSSTGFPEPSKESKMLQLIASPNNVLANSLTDVVDLVRPHLEINKPSEIVFNVGTQINGIPHIGTYLVQCASFLLAQKVRDKFGVATRVEFGALDNAPFKMVESRGGHKYQKMYCHGLTADELNELVSDHYIPYFGQLQELTEVPYKLITYSESQAQPAFRRHFLMTLKHAEHLGWCVNPSLGRLRYRFPCPKCFYSEKFAERTELLEFDDEHAVFRCMCLNHGNYEVAVSTDGSDGTYIDLNTVYRNLVKESVTTEDDRLHVMVKGGDWSLGTQPIDWGLAVMGYSAIQLPMRIFTPQIVTEKGAKLSKSLIRDGDDTMVEVPEWIIDMGKFREQHPDTYADYILWLVERFLSHPRHMFRAYSYQEIVNILRQCPKGDKS